jgi:hypothetical protein
VEWCDQSELASLRYLKLPAEQLFPPRSEADREMRQNEEVHLLATSSVNGPPARDSRHVWLQEYAPREGVAFRLLEEWAVFGLRLYVPDSRDHLELYPNMNPGKEAARRLAQGLFAGQPIDLSRNRFCALLQSAVGRQLIARTIDGDAFQPLITAFPWRCALDVAPLVSEVARKQAAQAREDLLQQIKAGLEQCLGHVQKTNLVGRHFDGISSSLDAVDKILNCASEIINDLRADVPGLLAAQEGCIDGLEKTLKACDQIGQELHEAAESLASFNRVLSTQVDSASTLIV